jgi:uncharacterized membrane-anchored protein
VKADRQAYLDPRSGEDGMTRLHWLYRAWISMLVVLTAVAAAPGMAQPQPAPSAAEQELRAAATAALASMRHGPVEVRLREQAVLRLPAGYAYIDTPHARRLLHALGNRIDGELDGMIVDARQPLEGWFVVIDFAASGYVRDDDAKDWKADDLLASLREGTAEGNNDRRARGFPELEIVGWVQRPTYDKQTHRLVWSAETRTKGASPDDRGVNYNTYALGREGYFALNLVTDLAMIESLKPRAGELLAALAYVPGKRYEDFNPSTDRVAEYGLAALVAGTAAKKLGLFALVGVLLAKFWKIAALAVMALGAGAFKLFGGRAQ